MLKNLFNNKKTFKDVKHHGGGAEGKRNKLSEYCKTTLGSGNMRHAVACPKGEDSSEWLAVNSVDFFNEISMLYGVVTEFCTKTTCPVMCAGPRFEYLWADNVKIKTPIKVSAPEYVDLLMTWVESQLNDETIFPIQHGNPFPKNFNGIVKVIFKRLFRVYAHIYHSHLDKLVSLGLKAHLNTCFKHFIFFVDEFKFMDEKELEPLQEVVSSMLGTTEKKDDSSNATTTTS